MAFYNKYPYTDFHELNLDWFLGEFKKLQVKVTDLDTTVQQFTTFVTNYFDNLDVQQEINNKLDAMVADGTIQNLLRPLLDDFEVDIDNQINAQNAQITDVTDRLGVLEGRMDTFASLPDGSIGTTADAEMVDIRIGENGNTYATSGDSVRAQIGNIYSDIEDASATFTNNIYIDNNGAQQSYSAFKASGFIALYDELGLQKKHLKIRTWTNSAAYIAFYDDTQTFISGVAGSGYGDEEITVDSDSVPTAYYVRVSCLASYTPHISVIAETVQVDGVRMQTFFDSQGNEFDYSSNMIEENYIIGYGATKAAASGYGISHPVKVLKGCVYKFTSSSSDFGANVYIGYCDENGVMTRSVRYPIVDNTVSFTAEENGFVVFSIFRDTAAHPRKSIVFAPEYVYDGKLRNKLTGKKILYNGDSIIESRFGGFSDNGGAFPYMIAEMTGGFYTNYAASGGTLSAYAGSSHQVCNDIANMDSYADLVCIGGGINDYWYNVPMGSFVQDDFTNPVDKSTVTGALESIFRDSINKWVGTPIVFVITHKITTTAYTQNSAGYTFDDLRKRMIQVCEKYSIPYIDMFTSGGLNAYMGSLDSAFLNGGANQHPDGCHPDAGGYRKYYVPRVIAKFMEVMP